MVDANYLRVSFIHNSRTKSDQTLVCRISNEVSI